MPFISNDDDLLDVLDELEADATQEAALQKTTAAAASTAVEQPAASESLRGPSCRTALAVERATSENVRAPSCRTALGPLDINAVASDNKHRERGKKKPTHKALGAAEASKHRGVQEFELQRAMAMALYDDTMDRHRKEAESIDSYVSAVEGMLDQLWELHLCSASLNAMVGGATPTDADDLDVLLNELERAISPSRALTSSQASCDDLY